MTSLVSSALASLYARGLITQKLAALGRGTYGYVFATKTTAIKVFKVTDETSFVNFVAELLVCAVVAEKKLAHCAPLTSWTVGPSTGVLFMPRVRTMFLTAVLELSKDRAKLHRFATGLLAAVRNLHGVGLTHNDISAGNVGWDPKSQSAVLFDYSLVRPVGGETYATTWAALVRDIRAHVAAEDVQWPAFLHHDDAEEPLFASRDAIAEHHLHHPAASPFAMDVFCVGVLFARAALGHNTPFADRKHVRRFCQTTCFGFSSPLYSTLDNANARMLFRRWLDLAGPGMTLAQAERGLAALVRRAENSGSAFRTCAPPLCTRSS